MIAGDRLQAEVLGLALGYVWSVVKPLALFTMLYLVFGRRSSARRRSRSTTRSSLLIGIVLFTFFSDATTLGMSSLVAREILLRKLSFPRLIIPTSRDARPRSRSRVNLTVVAAFHRLERDPPRSNWLLLVPLLLELYVFILGVALILATLFVRLRDIGQVWELATQLMFYASPIIYPVGFLPPWAAQDRLPQPVHAGRCRTSGRSCSTRTSRRTGSPRRSRSAAAGRLLPIAIALGDLRRRPRPSSGARHRGSRSACDVCRAVEVDGVCEDLPAAARSSGPRSRSTSCTRSSATTYETQRALDDVSFDGRAQASSSASSARTAAARARC